VVLIGAPGSLRSAVTRRLRTRTALLVCLDEPGHLPHVLAPDSGARSPGLAGATVVFLTVPGPPGLRRRPSAQATGFEEAALTARSRGAARVLVISTVFLYADDRGSFLDGGSPIQEAPETAPAAAAERAARLFAQLGGDSVVVRLGWTYGRDDITSRVLAAARRGWRLIDGEPDAWLAMIAETDAADAVLPALSVPVGTYNVTDGCPVTQATLNARLAGATGRSLHPLDDPRWGGGILFGTSRRILDGRFGKLTGWQPRVPRAAESLADLLPASSAGS
jgi:nucleoside-diphosphate-sugar epimerase